MSKDLNNNNKQTEQARRSHHHKKDNAYDEECCCSSSNDETSITKSSSLSDDSYDAAATVLLLHAPTLVRRRHGQEELPWLREQADGYSDASFHLTKKKKSNIQEKQRHFSIHQFLQDLKQFSLPFLGSFQEKKLTQLRLVPLLSLVGFVFVFLLWFFFLDEEQPPLNIGHVPTMEQGRALMKEIQASSAVGSGLTLVLTGSILPLLHDSIRQYAACSVVQQIHVNWSNNHQMPLPRRFLQEGKVAAAAEVIRTNAVLLLDADVSLSCQDLNRAMVEWQRDSTRLVGFAPLYMDDGNTNNVGGSYSVLSSKALMAHKALVKDLQPTTRATNDSCSSFLLAAKWAMLSQQAPTALTSNIRAIDDGDDNNVSCHSRLLKALKQRSLPFDNVVYTSRTKRMD